MAINLIYGIIKKTIDINQTRLWNITIKPQKKEKKGPQISIKYLILSMHFAGNINSCAQLSCKQHYKKLTYYVLSLYEPPSGRIKIKPKQKGRKTNFKAISLL